MGHDPGGCHFSNFGCLLIGDGKKGRCSLSDNHTRTSQFHCWSVPYNFQFRLTIVISAWCDPSAFY